MSCYHIYDCPRCGSQAERLTQALDDAIKIIHMIDADHKDLEKLEGVLHQDGVDFS